MPTWNEVKEFINNLEPRFMNAKAEIFDCESGNTITDFMIVKDCSVDPVYDVEHPQIWINCEAENVDNASQ